MQKAPEKIRVLQNYVLRESQHSYNIPWKENQSYFHDERIVNYVTKKGFRIADIMSGEIILPTDIQPRDKEWYIRKRKAELEDCVNFIRRIKDSDTRCYSDDGVSYEFNWNENERFKKHIIHVFRKIVFLSDTLPCNCYCNAFDEIRRLSGISRYVMAHWSRQVKDNVSEAQTNGPENDAQNNNENYTENHSRKETESDINHAGTATNNVNMKQSALITELCELVREIKENEGKKLARSLNKEFKQSSDCNPQSDNFMKNSDDNDINLDFNRKQNALITELKELVEITENKGKSFARSLNNEFKQPSSDCDSEIVNTMKNNSDNVEIAPSVTKTTMKQMKKDKVKFKGRSLHYTEKRVSQKNKVKAPVENSVKNSKGRSVTAKSENEDFYLDLKGYSRPRVFPNNLTLRQLARRPWQRLAKGLGPYIMEQIPKKRKLVQDQFLSRTNKNVENIRDSTRKLKGSQSNINVKGLKQNTTTIIDKRAPFKTQVKNNGKSLHNLVNTLLKDSGKNTFEAPVTVHREDVRTPPAKGAVKNKQIPGVQKNSEDNSRANENVENKRTKDQNKLQSSPKVDGLETNTRNLRKKEIKNYSEMEKTFHTPKAVSHKAKKEAKKRDISTDIKSKKKAEVERQKVSRQLRTTRIEESKFDRLRVKLPRLEEEFSDSEDDRKYIKRKSSFPPKAGEKRSAPPAKKSSKKSKS